MVSRTGQLHQAARHLVAAQALLHGYESRIDGPSARVLVNGKVVHVFSRTTGQWQATRTPPIIEDADVVAFVDLRSTGPEFYLVTADEAREDIASRYAEFINRHGGERPRSPGSPHKTVDVRHIAHGRDRWDLLA
jgi:hypothetical protein